MTSKVPGARWGDGPVLVTGATGILGSWLVKALLAREAHVVAFVMDADARSELLRSGDIGRVSVVHGTLEDYQAIERAISLYEVETVFHLGAQTIVPVAQRFPLATFEANIRGTYNLLEAARRAGGAVRRVVVASSDKAYGASRTLPYHEEMPLQGRHPYDVSKTCTDLVTQAYHQTYGLPVVITRCGNIYGGGDLNWSRIVPGTIRSYLRHEAPIIRSDGTFLRDYLFVKDAVQGYIDVARAEDAAVVGESFNLSPERPTSVLEIVRVIADLMGSEAPEPKILDAARGEIHDQYLSAAKARAAVGWEARYDLETGLGETIDWYRDLLA